ncbi:MAG: hypothetical protein IJ689_03735 [Alphaproteobacteria bacterium]|nr:hypothetical protein [Alphaproteobacteria bacterium]
MSKERINSISELVVKLCSYPSDDEAERMIDFGVILAQNPQYKRICLQNLRRLYNEKLNCDEEEPMSFTQLQKILFEAIKKESGEEVVIVPRTMKQKSVFGTLRNKLRTRNHEL